MKQFTFLVVVILATIAQGYGLKCYSCMPPASCQTASEVTCDAPYDRCFAVKGVIPMAGAPGGKVTMEMRNCTVAVVGCTEAGKQQMCKQMNKTGTLKSCNYSCCEGDLCNDGKSSGGLTPSKPASNVSLSCYECGSEGMGPNGTGTPLTSCSAPKQRKCGELGPGVSADRCMTVKYSVKNPKTGALLEQEYRNCSHSSMMCTGPYSPCNSMNKTGEIAKCNVQCCEGNLCNGVAQPTTGPAPTGPKAGQTPLAVSGILAILSIILAFLFK